ncbi:hypothetical protein COW36_14865 [bacterium (Candidatus Blackallbacteria) CG17_big_fil_post_rev_8_21_14_2_50_48_46]|uniref:Uncharacterized protein n=1 Tax=bacterium (Candidatus Blackallbacteria) CG17_big_fil_post_rev_8_21_14_2_50_48_46 TaxID=2014261 RepID=A0A2M7G3F9_9BACT|nr:MAG: hypothetical protein COW64_11685 [bacterium (Candidatus Blackallbacteria) CG18_big_fil_WC_8_21_14_2_50_49_26]PIW15992.1 MAG: hypothetical protein COW36_14865 [bacterium (Candidatus Blackallbacteria) CG17_big_fil_post_rev_8_21_14_2_50_48_46]PIW50404.1 MAG: hypothetical protein COW20_02580 [bacterium (Candidatus Blackallbacteria) CG13_big_fil_rev_8_21_14_2_50_49_14]
MTQRVDEIDARKEPSRQNALDAWRQMSMKNAERRTQNNSTNTSLNDRSNSNDRIQDSLEGNFEGNATAGVGGGQAAIKQAQASDSSNTGGQGSGNFSGQGQRDANMISNIALASDKANGLRAAVQVSFNLDPEERELKVAQKRLEAATERLGITPNPEDIQGMGIEDINQAIKALAQRTKEDLSPKALKFVNTVIPTQDFFDPIAIQTQE